MNNLLFTIQFEEDTYLLRFCKVKGLLQIFYFYDFMQI